jgi:hypothetical protein
LVVVTVVALVAAVLGWSQWRDARSDADDSAREVAELRRRVDTLEDGRDDGDAGADGTTPDSADPQDPLDELLGDDPGGLGNLLGGDAGSLAACMGAGDLGGLLGGGDAEIPDDDPRAQYDAVAEWVAEERGLSFDQVPTPTFVSAEEMERRVSEQVVADYPEDVARDDEELLVAFNVIDPGTDLREQYSEFVGSQVAGYYDPETGELVVLGDDDEPFDATELTTIAHELEHALADQSLGLPEEVDDTHTDDPDAQLAQLALVEGDATLTMSRFQLAALDLSAMLGLMGGGELGEAEDALGDAPPYLVGQLMFPYLEGLSFVCGLHAEGGWDAVDAAYDKLPTTTAQILFPDRYAAGEGAVATPDPTTPTSSGFTRVRELTFGAAELMFLFETAGLDNARERVEAWAGGKLSQWRNPEGDTSVRIALVQHDDAEGDDLCESVRAWTDTLDRVRLACEGDLVNVSIGAP